MLASRRSFLVEAEIDGAVQTQERSSNKLPNWSIGRRKICGLPGASCITLDRLLASVAI